MLKPLPLHKIRKSIIADAQIDIVTLRAALALLEGVDWHTQTASFSSQQHIANWAKKIGERYGLDGPAMALGFQYLMNPGQTSRFYLVILNNGSYELRPHAEVPDNCIEDLLNEYYSFDNEREK